MISAQKIRFHTLFSILCDFVFRSVHWVGWKMPQAKFLQFEHFLLNKEPEALNLPLVGEPKLFTISNFIMIKVFDKDNKFIFCFICLSFQFCRQKEKRFSCVFLFCMKSLSNCVHSCFGPIFTIFPNYVHSCFGKMDSRIKTSNYVHSCSGTMKG